MDIQVDIPEETARYIDEMLEKGYFWDEVFDTIKIVVHGAVSDEADES